MSPSRGLSGALTGGVTAPVMTQVRQRLTQFWVERGHVLLPPCDFAIPAGSMHPDVFFNLLEDRPWGSALVQPVRRPRDGRHGLHPFRLARHLEFHVLLRHGVEAMQDLYVHSLEALGLDLAAHDLCFSDGPWESHSLAAWGNGWHVQLDGLGVARLTFLRHLAGRPLARPAAELVYGIERTALVLAEVPDVKALIWGDGVTDGEPWRRSEEEMSRYAFEVADADLWQRSLDRREEEARRCLDAGLPRTAYELAVGNLEHVELLLARGQLEVRHRLRHLQRVQELVLAAAQVARAAMKPGSETETSGPLPAGPLPAGPPDGLEGVDVEAPEGVEEPAQVSEAEEPVSVEDDASPSSARPSPESDEDAPPAPRRKGKQQGKKGKG